MRNFFKLIRFSHTIFAMPFALGVYFLLVKEEIINLNTDDKNIFTQIEYFFNLKLLKLILTLIFARTGAMLFNRWVDWEIDKKNTRTQYRHKLLSKNTILISLISSSIMFILICLSINKLCFYLSPLALFIVYFYSMSKRWTNFPHLFLGIALAVAPSGVWIAMKGELSSPILILSAGVVLWVMGFDIIYACMDEKFDKQNNIGSIVAKYGKNLSLHLVKIFHLISWILFIIFGIVMTLSWAYYFMMFLVMLVLLYENFSIKLSDLKSLNKIFFRANALLSVLFFIACVL